MELFLSKEGNVSTSFFRPKREQKKEEKNKKRVMLFIQDKGR
jgi:hypothetical protein